MTRPDHAHHHPEHGGPTMDANTPNPENPEIPRPIPTPADAHEAARTAQRIFNVTNFDERPAHATPLTELNEEQRTRVEALHAARRVLGNPINRDGQLPAFWAETATGLADYIVTGAVILDTYGEDEDQATEDEPQQTPQGTRVGVVEIDLQGDLPDDMPPQVKHIVESVRQKLRQEFDPETRRANIRKYVDEHRDKPDGYKELHAQGIFPVDGSEPPRDEALHDIDGRRWTFNRQTLTWERQPTPADLAAGPHLSSSTWGPALAEFGPFHSCKH